MNQKTLHLPIFALREERRFAGKLIAFLLTFSVSFFSSFLSNAQSCLQNDIWFTNAPAGDTKTICVGDPATNISIDNAGAAPTGATTTSYLWEVSTDGGVTFANVLGTGNARTYTVHATYKATAGVYKFRRLVGTSATCNGFSDVVTLTVNTTSANAGNPLGIVCSGGINSTELLGGTIGGQAIRGTWFVTAPPSEVGTGTWTDNSGTTPGITTWTPRAALTNADVTLTLRTDTLTCSSAVATKKVRVRSGNILQFTTQPAAGSNTVKQDKGFPLQVSVFDCASNTTNTSFNGPVTVSVYTGCGFVSKTVNAVGGTAIFSGADSVFFTRSPQTNVQLKAKATGYDSAFSNVFNVGTPGATPTPTVVAYQNFEDAGTWNWAVGPITYSGSGAGADWTVVKTINGNKSLCKSYTTENAVSAKRSTTTITFDTKTADLSSVPLTDYSSLRLRFKIGSIYDVNGTPRTPAYSSPYVYPSGGETSASGVDPGENMSIEMNIDGTWYPLLSYLIGTDNYLFAFSSGNTNLAYNANVTYTQPTANSSFTVFIPDGTTSVGFRMIATNNRPPENWAIDSIYLSGTKNVPNMPKLTPTTAGTALLTCPASVNTLSAYLSNAYGTVTYSWAPATYITAGATSSSPTVILPSGLTTPYTITGTFTDEDGCYDTAKIQLTFPGGGKGQWYGYKNQDWFQCENWGLGDVPDDVTNVTINNVPNLVEINPLSPQASLYGGIAYAQGLDVIDTIWMQQNAILKVRQNLIIRNTTGRIDMGAGGANTGTSSLYLKGNWNNIRGTLGFAAGKGKVILDSTVAQTIATGTSTPLTTETFNNLTVNKTSGGVTLADSIVVMDQLELSGGVINARINSPDATNAYGILVMDTAATVTGSPSTTAYVNGQMRKRTNSNHADEFTFPIGKASSPYHPASVLPVGHVPGLVRTDYTAEYFYNTNPASRYDHPFLGSAPLMAVLKDRYWQIDKLGDGTAKVALYYTATPSPTDWVFVGGLMSPPSIDAGTNVAVAHDSGARLAPTSYWHFTKAANNFNVSGPLYEAIYYTNSGKVYSGTMSSFSPFTIGFGDNTILPVTLLGFEGRLLGTDGSLSWKVADAGDLAALIWSIVMMAFTIKS